jgi:ribosomal protein L11 methyltransferase
MNWLELSVEADPEAVEAVSELFSRYGYNGGVVVEQPLGPTAEEPATWEDLPNVWIDNARPVSVRTYIANDARAREVRKEIEQALWHLAQMRSVGPLSVEERDEEDWANTWKTYYVTLRVGRRTVIKPSWLEYTLKDDDVVVDLDPGMAFGTGYHPTTSLCLEALEDYVQPETNILDLGTGSGILAIAAAKLGGPSVRVFGVDIDGVAVDAARENVKRNGLDEQIRMEKGGTLLAADIGPYNLIVANLLAKIITDLSGTLYELLEPGGVLISSGIFHERADGVVEALERAKLPVRERRQEGDWVCLVSVREQ